MEDLVYGTARCHEEWSFRLVGDRDDGATKGLTLIITVRGDAYHPETSFLFPVPAATFDGASWQRWLWDRVLDVHRHETGVPLRGLSYGPPRYIPVQVLHQAPDHG